MKKLAIIGASYLQLPLILRAKEMGIETHVFAWKANDVGETEADYFYPISIVEKDQILDQCQKIGVDGITSIASDLAAVTVNYVAEKMDLTGNGIQSSFYASNKHAMRTRFAENGDPSPKSMEYDPKLDLSSFQLPLIVKPADRSGSRGITKIEDLKEIPQAVSYAKEESFTGEVLVEEFAEGEEFSVECISWEGKHTLLAITRKFTTGSPSFVEMGHMEPAFLKDDPICEKIRSITYHALDSLQIRYGASHTEVKIDEKGNIKIIEIGGRMGGDLIGSSLVRLSTGVDFVRAVIEVALGQEPQLEGGLSRASAIRYFFSKEDIELYNEIKSEHPEYIVEEYKVHLPEGHITDSSVREGYFVMCADSFDAIDTYMRRGAKSE
ncbi:MAG: ATP-grasp domain-containing protein [Clostridiales bacterium]|nr:ATP-grasp domain-containing protein [Clostridiales bacterium]